MSRRRALVGYAAAVLLATAGVSRDDLLALAAAVVMVALVGTQPDESPPNPASGAAPARATAPLSRALRIMWGGALLASLAAAVISLAVPTSPLAGAFWLCALALLCAAGATHDGVRRAHLTATFAACRTHAAELAAITAITLLAFGLRAVNLADLPPVVHGDEGEMGVIARELLAGNVPPLFEASPFFSLPYVFNYLQAGSLMLFGQDVGGLRMLSVLVGAASVPLCYWIARAGWGVMPALAAAWLFAIGHIYIHFSRLGFVFIESVFFMLALLAVLVLIARAEPGCAGYLPFIAAGTLLGLAQYFYFASRAMPFIAAPLLLHLWRSGRASPRQVTALGAATFVAFAPLGTYFLTHADVFLDRVGFVSILRDANASHTLGRQATLAADWLPLLQVQLARNLGLFVRGGDAGGFYFQNIPAFDALTAALCWLGVGGALARPLRYHEFALLVWSALGLLLGGVLTIDAPSAQRLTVMLPAICVLGGVAVARILSLLAPLGRGLGARVIGFVALAAVAVLLLFVNGDFYFRQYAQGTQGREAALIGRMASAAPAGTRLVLFGAPVVFSNHGAIRFTAPGARFLDPPSASAVELRLSDGPMLVFAVPDRLADARAIRERFSGGDWAEQFDPLGRLILVTYRLP